MVANQFSLAGLISRPRGASLDNISTYRKYVSNVSSRTIIGGNYDVSTKQIRYEVGARFKTVDEAMRQSPSLECSYVTAYDTGRVLSDTFSALARKYTNFSQSYEKSDLCGVVYRIAQGLAADSVYSEGITASTLLGKRQLRLHGIGTFTSPAAANAEMVFIPRGVDSILAPDTFSVLAFAVCGAGGAVATDFVEMDVSTREPKLRDVEGYSFAPAAVDALRILGANMDAAGVGDLFSYCVVKGFNSIVSVVSHSDEGGFLRDALRCGGFSPPFGGIHPGLDSYVGLPALSTTNGDTVACYVDAIMLGAAAVVAHCDPGITHNGVWYPTIVSGDALGSKVMVPGTASTSIGVSAGNRPSRNLSAILRGAAPFCNNYTAALAKLFGMRDSGSIASLHLLSSLGAVSPNCRHLDYDTVAPYFWVEPTSIIPHDFTGFVAETEGYASYCSRGDWRSLKAWDDIVQVGEGNHVASNYVVRFRSARTAPFLAHFHGHAMNGLAHVVPLQADTNGTILLGPGVADMRAGISERACLAKYLWVRGQSPFVCPGEFTNLGETMGIEVIHGSISDGAFLEPNHVPGHLEFLNAVIEITASAPVGQPNGKLTEWSVKANRDRCDASRALTRAIAKSAAAGGIDVELMTPLFSAPPRLRGRPAAADLGPGPTAMYSISRKTIGGERGALRSEGDIETGLPLAAVQMNESLKGPMLLPSNQASAANVSSGTVEPNTPVNRRDAVPSAISPSPDAGEPPRPEVSS